MRARAWRIAVYVWALCMFCAGSAVLAPSWVLPLVVVLSVAGAGGLAWWVHRSVLEPAAYLTRTMKPNAEPQPLSRTVEVVASEYRDMLERLAAASRATSSRETALRHAGEGFVVLDEQARTEYANPAARTLLPNIEAGRRLGQPDLERIVALSDTTGRHLTEELTVRTPEARHVTARCVPLESGGSLLLIADRDEAHRLDRVRRDFVANVSHELKTPVASMRALAEVAAMAIDDGELGRAAGFVLRLEREAQRLGDLVTDLLDLSRVEAGQLLSKDEIDVRAVLEESAERCRPIADVKGVSMRIEGGAAWVQADRAQLGMALQNLVENAVRYSDHGTVSLRVEGGPDWTSVVVSDEGIGIPADELPRIFERFYRVDRARSRATGGTGLGLSIVRHVAENHGGRVEVRSELGLGSEFTLLIPSASAGPAAPPRAGGNGSGPAA
ncbi:MAG TPA: ATP-binding protein [Actinomycetota bacterium]|nr:ATP-binding protein [Actinomycetota bacterium]